MNRVVGATVLVTGVTVGATVLALPFTIAQLGFPLAILVLLGVWLVTVYSSLLTLEVNLWFPSGANFVTMAYKSVGRWAAIFTWIFYVFFFYSFITAYLSGANEIIELGLFGGHLLKLPHWLVALPWLLIYGATLFFRFKSVDIFNRILVAIMVISLLLVLLTAMKHIKLQLLISTNPHYLMVGTPIFFTAFAFQYLIPTLRIYLQSNFSAIRKSIIAGSTFALLFYVVWIFIFFALIPLHGVHSFVTILNSTHPFLMLIEVMQLITRYPSVGLFIRIIIIMAIATTFIGMSFSLFDFLADSFKIIKNSRGKLILIVFVLLPPYLFTLIFPHKFVEIIFYSGILALLLYYIFPIVMVWYGRYIKQLSFGQKVFGGRTLLVINLIVLLSILGLQFFN